MCHDTIVQFADPKVCFLHLVRTLRPDIKIVIEQPSSSFMLKLPVFQDLIRKMALTKHLTWMACFGASIWKPTHLLSNMLFPGQHEVAKEKQNITE